jgi:hypothetical protein
MSLDPITAGIDLAKTVVGKIWPDKSAQEQAELAAALAIVQGQLQINQAEAGSSSVFVAGWRPFIGWVCGAALCYTFLAYPALIWASALWMPGVKPPALGMDDMLYELLFGMLGMGALRTFEKIKGVAR